MDYKKLAIEKENGYIVATINNPPANTISQDVLRDLDNLLSVSLEDAEVRAIVITGSGPKLFSAGADVSDIGVLLAGKKTEMEGQDVLLRIERYPKPIIAAIQGNALGGGNELAMACHMRIMAETAKIGLPEINLGIFPGWNGTQRLPRLIGKTKALEMILTGDLMSAEEALSYGYANKVVPVEEVLLTARKLAGRLAQASPLVIKEILKVITNGMEAPMSDAIAIDNAGLKVVLASEDAKEGTTAFFEKRKPNFKGK